MEKTVKSELAMKSFGALVGKVLQGGEVIELIGDVGAGKTTFVKGLAKGLGIDENVQSPSFTISQVYENAAGVRLHHYDFYRLADAGIMKNELEEAMDDESIVTIIEWADTVSDVLPKDHLVIKITSPTEDSRQLVISGNSELIGKL